MILEAIEQRLGDKLYRKFDLMAGTSTGGIIALGLTTPKSESNVPYTAKEMLGLYEENGAKIFNSRKSDWLSMLTGWIPVVNRLFEKAYDAKNLEEILKRYFAENRIEKSLKNILITTYNIKSGSTFFFSTRLAKQNADENFLIREVARSTSAAPTFFEPSRLKNKDEEFSFVDGGVFANNPAIVAYAEAKEIWKEQNNTKATNPVVLADDNDLPFFMLSIGTGEYLEKMEAKARKPYTFLWLTPLLESVLMQSVAESTHYIMQHLLPSYQSGFPRYVRINIPIPKELTVMDNATPHNISALKAIAQEYIDKNEEKIALIADILAGRPSSQKWELLTSK
jgi:uncharacterized protein